MGAQFVAVADNRPLSTATIEQLCARHASRRNESARARSRRFYLLDPSPVLESTKNWRIPRNDVSKLFSEWFLLISKQIAADSHDRRRKLRGWSEDVSTKLHEIYKGSVNELERIACPRSISSWRKQKSLRRRSMVNLGRLPQCRSVPSSVSVSSRVVERWFADRHSSYPCSVQIPEYPRSNGEKRRILITTY